MLLHDDVVSDGQAKASTLASRFCCEEGIEHLLPYFGRNAGSVVANPDLNLFAEIFCRHRDGRFIRVAIVPLFALRRRIEAIGDQVHESPCNPLREYIDLTGGRIKGPLHIDLETLLFGSRAMISKIEALLDESDVHVDGPMFARTSWRYTPIAPIRRLSL